MDYSYFRPFVHYFLHLIFPVIIAYVFFRKNWKKTYFILLATMLVDADHLLSTPVFSPNRCSINFHFLHTYWAMGIYVLLLFFKGIPRIIGVGLLFHMLTDWIDCRLQLLQVL
ncbi:DUF6122 family protein [Chryseobacterium sp. SC28]|uniref:DUF6122 family protein n=1 Tax=Chryseobacterium sp. SC28 TaxID=2268028 RepID=UPI000F6487AC|nr:DUF6122 family protein [Chryseobacterium sp. SC28]RRQ47332.1 hypothetical protein DTW91_01225 [Chryseobacterium sp. SC28]